MAAIFVLTGVDKYYSQNPFTHRVVLDEAQARKEFDAWVAWGEQNRGDPGHGYSEVQLWRHSRDAMNAEDTFTPEERFASGFVVAEWSLE